MGQKSKSSTKANFSYQRNRVKRFFVEDFLINIRGLKIGEQLLYPANGYTTMQTAKRFHLEYESSGKEFVDDATSNTMRAITRIS